MECVLGGEPGGEPSDEPGNDSALSVRGAMIGAVTIATVARLAGATFVVAEASGDVGSVRQHLCDAGPTLL
jgi:hypothetical protein